MTTMTITINGKTKITGIFGWPVEHSLSPLMHNSAFNKLNLNFVYLPFPVKPSELKSATAAIRSLNLVGVNVTVPHKENIIMYLDELDEYANKIGAVNTVLNDNGKLKGFNTDAYGFMLSLKEKKIKVTDKKVLLLGAGGAAKAVAAVIETEKPKGFLVYDINKEKSQKLSKKFKCIPVSKDEIPLILKDIDLLINATPVGMSTKDGTPIALDGVKKTLFVYDLIYNRKTKLIKDALSRGLKACDGLSMLLYQGVRAFEIWTNRKAPIVAMRSSLVKQLRQKYKI